MLIFYISFGDLYLFSVVTKVVKKVGTTCSFTVPIKMFYKIGNTRREDKKSPGSDP